MIPRSNGNPQPEQLAYEVLWRKTTDADFPEENVQPNYGDQKSTCRTPKTT